MIIYGMFGLSINNVYLQKTKENVQYELNEEVTFNLEKFLEIMLNLKKIIEEVVASIKNEYKLWKLHIDCPQVVMVQR